MRHSSPKLDVAIMHGKGNRRKCTVCGSLYPEGCWSCTHSPQPTADSQQEMEPRVHTIAAAVITVIAVVLIFGFFMFMEGSK